MGQRLRGTVRRHRHEVRPDAGSGRGAVDAHGRLIATKLSTTLPPKRRYSRRWSSTPRTTRCCSRSSSCSARPVASSTCAETFKLAVKQADRNEDGQAVRASGAGPPRSRDRLNDVRRATVLFEQLFEDEPKNGMRGAQIEAEPTSKPCASWPGTRSSTPRNATSTQREPICATPSARLSGNQWEMKTTQPGK